MPDDRPRDQWGNPVTAAGADAVAALDDTVMGYLGIRRDTGERLKRTLALDPDMVMAHCMKGYFFLLMAHGPLQARVPKVLAQAEAGAAKATAREKAHVEALRHWAGGEETKAARVWEDILAEHPRDAVALRLCHHAYFYIGAAGDMRASVERVLRHWDKDLPGHGFVLGMHAFALEEFGDYGPAEQAGRRAIAANPADIWAVHAVAHVMEMQDRHADGIEWIASLEPHWNTANNFRYHVWWHRALMHLDRGETDVVMALYDDVMWDDDSDEYLDLCNDAALLLRLEILGVDVGERWRPVAEKCAERTDEHLLPFVDCHFVAALAADGRLAEAEDMVAAMREKGGVFGRVAAPVSDALIRHRRGDYAGAQALLDGASAGIVGMGGSHAQRDVFELVLIDAAIKAGDGARARGLLHERTRAKPDNPWSWRTYAGVLGSLGEDAAEAEARARMLSKR